MVMKKLCLTAALALVAFGGVAALRAQDGAKFSDEERARLNALSSRSIRPYRTTETSAKKPLNIYDEDSDDELNYFRDALDETKKSTREQKRQAAREARARYADPMDKPAADGSKFVDIFDESEVYSDDEEFVDPEDPDVKYESEENNILARADVFFQNMATLISYTFGVGSGGQGNQNGSGYGDPSAPSMLTMGPGITAPAMMDSSIVPGGGGVSGLGPGAPGMPGTAPKEVNVAPSAYDDSSMLFKAGGDNPYKAEVALDEAKDFDLYKADREFKPKPRATQNGDGMYPGGNATSGVTPMMGGVSGGGTQPSSTDP